MKILQVIPYFAPAWDYGGPVRVCYEISRQLVKMGHEVTVFTTDAFDKNDRMHVIRETLEGISIVRFKNINNYLAFRHKIFVSPGMLSLMKIDIDIIHLHEFHTLQNVCLLHLSKKLHIPYVLQTHGSLPIIGEKQILKKIFNLVWGYNIVRNASKIIVTTKQEIEQAKEYRTKTSNLRVVPNGINLDELEILPSPGQFRKKMKIPDDYKIILFLARLNKIKAPDLLAKAFSRISQEQIKCKLVFAGPDDGFLQRLKKYIQELGIGNNVIFTGALYETEKYEAFIDADVYVLPSIFETFPVSVIESLACGTPVVITDRCGICDEINGQSGIVVPFDEKTLYSAILKMLTDAALKHKYEENGKRQVKEIFNWALITKQIEQIYYESINING